MSREADEFLQVKTTLHGRASVSANTISKPDDERWPSHRHAEEDWVILHGKAIKVVR